MYSYYDYHALILGNVSYGQQRKSAADLLNYFPIVFEIAVVSARRK